MSDPAKLAEQLAQTNQELATQESGLREFINKVQNLRNNTLPGAKESFSGWDILGGILVIATEVLKKKVNDSIDSCDGNIDRHMPRISEIYATLKLYQQSVLDMGHLGASLQYFSQQSLLLVTVSAIHIPDFSVSISGDQKAAEIINKINEIGNMIAFAISFVAPELSLAISAILTALVVYFGIAELAIKLKKINELNDNLSSAFNIYDSYGNGIIDHNNQINKAFADLGQLLDQILGTGQKFQGNRQELVGEFLTMQFQFRNSIVMYNKLMSSTLNPAPDSSEFDKLMKIVPDDKGYGTVSSKTFFLVLYAKDHVAQENMASFLTKYGVQVPTGGVQVLVDCIEKIKRDVSK